MKQALSVFASFLLLLLLLVPHTVSAAQEESIGTVVAVRGEVTAVAGSGAERRLALKDSVFREDTIRTENGRIQLMFTDNTLISLGRQSEMVVAEYDWQPDGKSGAMKTRIKEGTFRVMGGAITKAAPENFSTETPAATIGIRGSMYAGKSTPESLTVVFQGGKGIDVANAAGTVAITRPGFGTRVFAPNQPPLPPIRFTVADLQEINTGLVAEPGKDEGKQEQEEGADQNTDDSDQGASEDEGQDGTADEEGQESASGDGSQDDSAGGDDAGAGDDQEGGESDNTDGGLMPDQQAEGEDGSGGGELDKWGDFEPVAAPSGDDGPNIFAPPVPFYEPPLLVNEIPKEEIQTGSTTTSVNLPTGGIYGYYGSISHTSTQDSGTDQFWMEINWENRALLGRIWDPDHETKENESVYFFGHYNTDDPSLSRIYVIERHKRHDQNIEAIWGSSTYAGFTGDGAETFQFTAAGNEYAIAGSQPLKSSWEAAGSGTLEIEPELVSGPSTKFQGFVMGKADNMANPDDDYGVFTGGLDLGINTANGTFSGSLTATAISHGTNTMDDLGVTVGGSNGSAYVLEDQFIGIIGSGTTGLKTYGNFLVTAHPDIQHKIESGIKDKESEYLTWGYWEIAYQMDGKDYHVFSDQGYWIAGVRTSPEDIDRLHMAGKEFTYRGGAMGIKVDGSGRTSNVGGATNITVDFLNHQVDGTITVNNIGFAFGTTDLLSNGSFSCSTTGQAVNGALYGPDAEAIGGNFKFTNSSDKYYGIFGGMR